MKLIKLSKTGPWLDKSKNAPTSVWRGKMESLWNKAANRQFQSKPEERVVNLLKNIGSLSKRKKRTVTGTETFARQDSGVTQIFILIISNGAKILSNVNVVLWRDVKRENRSLPVAVCVSKRACLNVLLITHTQLTITS